MASGNTKNFEFRLKKAGLIAVITGMVALLCFAFLLGVNVGKNIDTYPEKISSLPQKALALIWHKGKLQPTENLTDNKNPPEQEKEENKPKIKEKTPPAAPGKHKYIVQAASLKEKAKAYQLTKKIAELGFDPKIIPIEIKNKGTWYRVIISGFDNKAKAQESAAKISKKTGTDCIIRS